MFNESTNNRAEQRETAILESIVDAMMSSQDALNKAEGDAWSRILRDACREQKWQDQDQDQDEPSDLLAVC